MTSFREVIRCSQCGSALPASFEDLNVDSRCPKCDAALHSCRNCVNFDPGSRFECSQPIKSRIAKKDAENDCSHFELKSRVEKEVGSNPATKTTPEDPRDAFERLFKK